MHSSRKAASLFLAPLALVFFAGCTAATGSDGAEGESGTIEAESVRCAGGATVEGVDVSHWQGHIDWSAVKSSGKVFAFAGVGDGSYQDPTFSTNWAGMKSAGIIRGAYQYFEPGQDPIAQANILISKVGMLGADDLPAVIDVEATGGQSAATIAARVAQWVAHVKAGTGKTPIVYTGKYFWRDNVGGSTAEQGNALWIAAYGPSCPDIPSPWTNWKFFQYSDKGSVHGISGGTDVDKFNGTLADLLDFAHGTSGGGSPAPTPAPGGGGTPAPSPAPGLCYSHTLGAEVPLNTCVQSRGDSKWYQCAGPNSWVDRFSDPAACSSVHPL